MPSILRLPHAGALAAAVSLLLAAALPPAQAAGTDFGPLPPHNPYAGPPGTATMHGDTGSSDATPLPGPGAGGLTSKRVALQSACPTVLVGADTYPVALCTPMLTRIPTVHLLVHRTDTGAQVCSTPVLLAGGSGSENSPIGAGRSVFVASTYGYPYPALPEGAGESVPSSADFAGGLTRVDVRADGSGCDLKWDTAVRSSAVPRLSTADGLIHTVLRGSLLPGSDATSLLDPYSYAQIDPETGSVVRRQHLGASSLYDTLQMVGSIAPGGVVYQGTITGVVRIAAE
jgi:hypothetical protein